jgi:flavin-dependent dehydrogenase
MKEILIVGGGLAGGAAAAHLARSGAPVRVLERHPEPRHKVCGEFLSVEARRHLAALGLDLDRLGGSPISRVRLVSGARIVEADLPFTALGLTRLRLDEALLDHAEAIGARIDLGVTVRSFAGGQVKTTHGDVEPATLFLANGKHDLRGAKRPAAGALNHFIGFKMYYRVNEAVRAALSGAIEVILFQGGYAGLQLVENGIANLCLVIRDDAFNDLGRGWGDLFARLLTEPHLERRLGEAEPILDRPLTISGVPYGFIHRGAKSAPANLFRVGDQAAVIPSFCGDGMAIAVHSGRLAAQSVISGVDAHTYHTRVRSDVARQVRSATALQRLGDSRLGRSFIMASAVLAPHLLPMMAAWSRLPDRALKELGVEDTAADASRSITRREASVESYARRPPLPPDTSQRIYRTNVGDP